MRTLLLPCVALSSLLLPFSATAQDDRAAATTAASDAISSSFDAPAFVEEGAGSSYRGNQSTLSVLFHGLGFDVHAGVNGAGGDIALPVARRFNVRVGGDYLRYSGQFTEQGADVDAAVRLGNGRAALDWFPFGNGFRVSPQLVFAIQTRLDATVVIPPGRSIELNGQEFVSSDFDPLHGAATVRTRKTAPGISVGWGNISPHGDRHWSFPTELGFYYIGQPSLTVNFSGTACDPTQPPAIGCEQVAQDPDFQQSLAAFIRRNQHNLSYASFFPIASVGVGYRF